MVLANPRHVTCCSIPTTRTFEREKAPAVNNLSQVHLLDMQQSTNHMPLNPTHLAHLNVQSREVLRRPSSMTQAWPSSLAMEA